MGNGCAREAERSERFVVVKFEAVVRGREGGGAVSGGDSEERGCLAIIPSAPLLIYDAISNVTPKESIGCACGFER